MAAGRFRPPKEIYRETYERGSAMIRQELLPERFPFTPEGWRIDAIEVMAAGALDDGREFQEVRIYARETTPAAPKETA